MPPHPSAGKKDCNWVDQDERQHQIISAWTCECEEGHSDDPRRSMSLDSGKDMAVGGIRYHILMSHK